MLLQIYNWILFITIVIVTFIPTGICFAIISDDNEDGYGSYFLSLSCLLLGALPFVGVSIIPMIILQYIFIGSFALLLLIHLILTIVKFKYSINYSLSFICTIIVALLIFWSRIKILLTGSCSNLPIFNLKIPMIYLSFWLPAFILVIIFAFIIKPKDTRIINYAVDQANHPQQNRNVPMQDTLIKLTLENILEEMTKQYNTLYTTINTINHEIRNIRIDSALSTASGKKNENIKLTQVIGSLEVKLQEICSRLGNVEVKQMTVTNQILVRELTHFITTPLATIQTSCELIEGVIMNKNKEKERIGDNLRRINSAVEICKGILKTYRQIFLCTTSADDNSLVDMVKHTFTSYKGDKPLKLNLNIKGKYPDIPNYYIISIILPLIDNAICASKENSTIEVIEKDYVIKISNTFNSEIDISKLETDGYSTKENHYGMGLYTVRHLLASRALPPYKAYIKDNRIFFEIQITSNNS